MAAEDRSRWDARYSAAEPSADFDMPALPAVFAPYERLFPTRGFALDLACGDGTSSVWLAARGLEVQGVDISGVALARARRLAARHEVGHRCRFDVTDLDLGLPAGPPAEVVHCHLFRDPSLYRPIIDRLQDRGVLAIAVLSEVGARPGPFRAGAGELRAAFAELSVTAEGEEDGRAWLVATK